MISDFIVITYFVITIVQACTFSMPALLCKFLSESIAALSLDLETVLVIYDLLK